MNTRLCPLFFVGLTLFPPFQHPSFSEESTAHPNEKNGDYRQIRARASQILPDLLKDSDIQKRYQVCQGHQLKKDIDMGKCLWDGIGGILPPLGEEKRAEIQNRIRGRVGVDVGTVKVSGGPALKKFEKYYAKRLMEVIMKSGGDDEETGRKILADHTLFNKIYRSQLGKNVISALSSYCLDADGDDNRYLVNRDNVKEVRKKNLKKIGSTSAGGTTSHRPGVRPLERMHCSHRAYLSGHLPGTGGWGGG